MSVFCVATPGAVRDQILSICKCLTFPKNTTGMNIFWEISSKSELKFIKINGNQWKSSKSLKLLDNVSPRWLRLFERPDILGVSTVRDTSISVVYSPREPRDATRNRQTMCVCKCLKSVLSEPGDVHRPTLGCGAAAGFYSMILSILCCKHIMVCAG